MVRVNIEVGESTRERWKQFAEDNEEYSSMTHFLSVAAMHEIKEATGERPRGGSGVSSGSSTGGSDLDGVEEQLRVMNDRYAELEDAVERLELSGEGRYSREEVMNAVSDVLKWIPGRTEDGTFYDLGDTDPGAQDARSRKDGDEHDDSRGRTGDTTPTGTAEDIASELDEDEMLVRRALARLQRDLPYVESELVNGTRRYFQVE
jgi:hypothetical protein